MSDLLSLCDSAVSMALKKGADEAEAFGVDQKEWEVFLERNDVKICKSQLRTGIGIRVFKSTRLGFASVNSLDSGNVRKAVERVVSLASKAPKDKNNALPEPRRLRKVAGLYDSDCEGLDSGEVFRHATDMLRAAKGHDRRVVVDSGMFNSTIGEKAICNSLGVEGLEMSSNFQYMMVAFARDGQDVGSFDYFYEGTHRVGDVDTQAPSRRLAERVVKSLNAKKVRSFKGTVILSPSTAHILLAYVLETSVDANNVQKGMSRLSGKIGEKIASGILTVRDDGTTPGGLASSSFDREGSPHEPMTILDKGRLRAYLYNTYTAMKDGKATTGHAVGSQRSVPTIGASNFILESGKTTLDDMVAGVKDGILVTRFSGFPETESGDFSGAVKGGFLIKDGEIAHPVKETMISGNSFDLMARASAVSKEFENLDSYRLPYVKVDGIAITGG
jgi:PmbA protein